MRYYLLDSVHVLAIQCDVLSSVAKSHKKFLQWCQEPLLTGILWHLLESSHSQVKMGPRPFSSRICYFHVQLKLFPSKQKAQCKILGKRFPCPNLLSKLTKPCTFWYTFLGWIVGWFLRVVFSRYFVQSFFDELWTFFFGIWHFAKLF